MKKGKFIDKFPYYIPSREELNRAIIFGIFMGIIICSLALYLNYSTTCNSINITQCNRGGIFGFYFK